MRAPLAIRPAGPADAADIVRISAPAIRGGEVFDLPRDMADHDIAEYWLGGGKAAFLGFADGTPVCVSYLRANPGSAGDVANAGYATHPDHQGRGAARALCLHSLEEARRRGFAAMQFNFVVSTNAAAMRAWTDCGFAVVARLPGAFAHPRLGPVDALVMRRAL